MRKVGDYDWRQVSMWETTPDNCIEKYITVEGLGGKEICQFYLKRIKKIISETHWETETVESLDGVPEYILNWRNDNYRLKVAGKAV